MLLPPLMALQRQLPTSLPATWLRGMRTGCSSTCGSAGLTAGSSSFGVFGAEFLISGNVFVFFLQVLSIFVALLLEWLLWEWWSAPLFHQHNQSLHQYFFAHLFVVYPMVGVAHWSLEPGAVISVVAKNGWLRTFLPLTGPRSSCWHISWALS